MQTLANEKLVGHWPVLDLSINPAKFQSNAGFDAMHVTFITTALVWAPPESIELALTKPDLFGRLH
jgi:hypothetical protein